MIPGSNIYRAARRLIGGSTIRYQPYATRAQNAAKQWVTTYGDAFDMDVSIQAVDRNSYVEYGLDFQKNYVRIYTDYDVIDIERDTSGDRFWWQGRFYQLESDNPWFQMDGWSSALAVDVGLGAQPALPVVSP